MAKKKRWKDLSEVQRMRLEKASMNPDEGVYGSTRDAKREFRRRQKAGTLNEIINPVKNINKAPEDKPEEMVKEKKTVVVSRVGDTKARPTAQERKMGGAGKAGDTTVQTVYSGDIKDGKIESVGGVKRDAAGNVIKKSTQKKPKTSTKVPDGNTDKNQDKDGMSVQKRTVTVSKIGTGKDASVGQVVTDENGKVISSEEIDPNSTKNLYNKEAAEIGEGETGNRGGGDPTNVTSKNVIEKDLIEGNGASETNEKLDKTNQANEDVVQDKRNREATKKVVEKIEDGANGVKSEQTLNDGSTVDQHLTNDAIDAGGDAVIQAAIDNDPDLSEMAKEYRDALTKAKSTEGEPAIERLGLQDYYPTANHRIAVGSYSRKTLGSGNIYAASEMLMPWAVVDARKRAIEEHAKNKAKQKDAIMEMAMVKGAIQYQHQFDNMGMNLMEKYGKLTNYQFDLLLKGDTALSRQFRKDIYQYQTFGKQTIDMNKRVEKLMKNEVGEDKISLPKYVRDAMQYWYNGSGNIEEMYKDRKEFAKQYKNLQAYDSLIYNGNLIVDKIQKSKLPLTHENWDFDDPTIAKSASEAFHKLSSVNHDEVYSAVLEFVPKERLEPLVESMMKDKKFYINSSEKETKEELMKYVANMLAPQVEQKMQTIAHKNGFLWYNYANLKDRKQARKERKEEKMLVTTAVNEAGKSGVRGKMSAAGKAAAEDPNGDVGQAILSVFSNDVNVSPRLDANGKFKDGIIAGSITPSNQKEDLTLGDQIYTVGGKDYNYNDYIRYIKEKPDGDRSDSERYMLTTNGNTVIKGATPRDEMVYYSYEKDGKNVPVTVDDDPRYLEEGTSNVRYKVSYGGNFKAEVPVIRDGNKIMQHYYVNTLTGEKKIFEAPAVRDANGSWKKPTVTIPYGYNYNNDMPPTVKLEEKEISMDARISKDVSENDRVNIGQADATHASSSKAMTKGAIQGEEGYNSDGSGVGDYDGSVDDNTETTDL